MEEQIKKIEQFIESLKNPNTFPKEISDALVNLGFLKFDGAISYDQGAGGNHFEEIFIKYLNKRSMLSISQIPFIYVVNSITDDTVSFVSDGISPLDIQGLSVVLYTTSSSSSINTFPGGLDLAVPLTIINSTATTFQLSSDGINPIDITSVGVGTQYISFI